MYEHVINFFSILTISNEKNSKLESYRSRRDLQYLYKKYFYLISYKNMIFLIQIKHVKSYLFIRNSMKITKIIDIIEIYNFVVM